MVNDSRAYLATLGLSSPLALEGFLEAAPDAIVVVDGSGHIVLVNLVISIIRDTTARKKVEDANFDVHSASTLGLKLVAIFTEQVGGTIDLEREGGTRFRLRFTPGTHS